MLKKFYWFSIMILVIYILLIFKAPSFTKIIDEKLWFNWFTEFVTQFKWAVDETYTNLPSTDEIKDWYEKAYSWAIDIKDNIKSWIDVTKEKIDTARVALSWAEDTLNKVKDTYEETVDFIDWASKQLDEARKTIDKVTEVWKSISETIWTWSSSN